MEIKLDDLIEFNGRPHFIESIDGDLVNMWCFNNGERQLNITINLKSDTFQVVKHITK